MIHKHTNFGAGPAMLPEPVIAALNQNSLPGVNTDISILEVGHRTDYFRAILSELEDNLRQILAIPDHYHVLFPMGGGRMQFGMVPLNLMNRTPHGADYFDTGLWSQKAMLEAQRLGKVHCVASSQTGQYRVIPEVSCWDLREQAAYCHYVDNETAHGVCFSAVPKSPEGVPLVVDMTSSLLTKVINMDDYGLVYAASQKNLGPAGFSVVIIRDDLTSHVAESVPTVLQYQAYLKDKTPSTPAVFAIYVAVLVTRWLIEQGGLAAMARRNLQQAERLYQAIDASPFLVAPVDPAFRSSVNIVFEAVTAEHEQKFLEKAEQKGLFGLQGHHSVGGLRASLYNAMTDAGVDALVDHIADV